MTSAAGGQAALATIASIMPWIAACLGALIVAGVANTLMARRSERWRHIGGLETEKTRSRAADEMLKQGAGGAPVAPNRLAIDFGAGTTAGAASREELLARHLVAHQSLPLLVMSRSSVSADWLESLDLTDSAPAESDPSPAWVGFVQEYLESGAAPKVYWDANLPRLTDEDWNNLRRRMAEVAIAEISEEKLRQQIGTALRFLRDAGWPRSQADPSAPSEPDSRQTKGHRP